MAQQPGSALVGTMCRECEENIGTQYCSHCHKVVCNDDYCVDTIWKKHQRAKKNKHICDLVEIVLSDVQDPSRSDKRGGRAVVQATTDDYRRVLKKAGVVVYDGVVTVIAAAAYIAPELAVKGAVESKAALFGKNVVNVAKAAGYKGVRGSGLSIFAAVVVAGVESSYHIFQYFQSVDPAIKGNAKLLAQNVTKVWARGAAGFGGYVVGMAVGKKIGAAAGMAMAGPVGAVVGGIVVGVATGLFLDWIMGNQHEIQADKIQLKALARFGLDKSDLQDERIFSREAMDRKYRQIARSEHPDRYPSKQREYQTKRCADLVAAYSVILALLDEQ